MRLELSPIGKVAPARDATPGKFVGGMTAQARPGFEHSARHSPNRAASFVLCKD